MILIRTCAQILFSLFLRNLLHNFITIFIGIIGKDATRAFITGNFHDPSELRDEVSDLELNSFNGIREWEQFYSREYPRKGKLIGSFFDMNGCPTQSMHKVLEMYKQLDQLDSEKKNEDQVYPPCNSEWNQDLKKTRFWCTNRSGGIERDWIGVPRKLVTLSDENQNGRCVCVQTDSGIVYEDDDHVLKIYPGCAPSATECVLMESDSTTGDSSGSAVYKD